VLFLFICPKWGLKCNISAVFFSPKFKREILGVIEIQLSWFGVMSKGVGVSSLRKALFCFAGIISPVRGSRKFRCPERYFPYPIQEGTVPVTS